MAYVRPTKMTRAVQHALSTVVVLGGGGRFPQAISHGCLCSVCVLQVTERSRPLNELRSLAWRDNAKPKIVTVDADALQREVSRRPRTHSLLPRKSSTLHFTHRVTLTACGLFSHR